MPDKIKISVLPDGSFKVETDRVSQANHGNAEMLLREMVKLAGGASKTTRKGHTHTHDHTHDHLEH